MIRRISQEYEGSCPNDVESDTMTHSTRMKAVDELLRSHTYAAEMRSAAKSASTWLRYIGRSDASTDERAPGWLKKIKVETNKARIKLLVKIKNRNKRIPTRWNQLL